jgi:D-alanine-D-alanine ligase
LNHLSTLKVLLIEGTRSQENLIYKANAPASERGILSIAASLKRQNINFRLIESSDVALVHAIQDADVVLIYAHGEFGEDGRLQGWLDYVNKPYPGPGVAASAICLDKLVFKRLMAGGGVRTPNFREINAPSDATRNADLIGFPMMAKLRRGGSSLGITLLRSSSDFARWLDTIPANHLNDYLLEKFIQGRFVTVGVLQFPDELVVLPILAVLTKGEFYDDVAKMGITKDSGGPEYHVPAHLNGDAAHAVQKLAIDAFRLTGCEGISRVDIMIDSDGVPHVLEINTIPGMAENSNLTHMASNLGFSYDELVLAVLRTAFLKQVPGVNATVEVDFAASA